MFMSHLPELFGVLLLGLIFFGPKRLPEIGEAMGRGIRDFKKGMSQLDEKPTDAITTEAVEPVHIDRSTA